MTSVVNDVEKLEPSYLVVCGTVKWCNHFGKEFGGSSKSEIKHSVSMWPNNSIPRHISKWTENMFTHTKSRQMLILTLFIIIKNKINHIYIGNIIQP